MTAYITIIRICTTCPVMGVTVFPFYCVCFWYKSWLPYRSERLFVKSKCVKDYRLLYSVVYLKNLIVPQSNIRLY